MEIFGIEIKNKAKERKKMREYKKERYKVFTFAVPETEYDLYKEFFKNYGGFTKFIKEVVNEKGLKEKIELIKSVKAIKEQSLKEYEFPRGDLRFMFYNTENFFDIYDDRKSYRLFCIGWTLYGWVGSAFGK